MRVLYFIDSLVAGGAESSLAALAPHYAKRGVELGVAYLHERPGVAGRLRSGGAELFCLEGSGGRAGWARRGAALARSRAPDLVHTTLFEGDIVGRIAGVAARTKIVTSLVNPQYGAEQFANPKLRNWRIRGAQVADVATGRFVTRWHSIAEYVAEVMAHRLLIPRRRIDVVPRGRDPRTLGTRTEERRRSSRALLGIEDRERLVLAASRQEYQKGLDVLLESFTQVRKSSPSARLVIAGRGGNQSEILQQAVGRLGLADCVILVGARTDVPDLLCAADAFVLPSRWEGFGGVLLEAMALRAPIVASDLPAVREVVSSGEHALLVDPEDPDALARAISRTLDDATGTAERTNAALARFSERFTIDRVADQMVAFYERSLG